MDGGGWCGRMIEPRPHALTRSEVFREFVAACLRAMDGEECGIDWAARDGRRCDWCEDTRACEPAKAGRDEADSVTIYRRKT